MADKINENIASNSLYGQQRYRSESQMMTRLAELRQTLDDEYYVKDKDLRKKRNEEELRYLEKAYERKVAFAIQVKAVQDKLDKLAASKLKDSEKKRLQKKYKDELASYEKIQKALKKKEDAKYKKDKATREAIRAETQELIEDREKAASTFFDGKKSLKQRFSAMRDLKDEQGLGAVADALLSGLADLTQKLDNQIEQISGYQSKWDTRLQNSGKSFEGWGFGTGIASKIAGITAISPIVSQKKVMENIDKLIDRGIAYNIEQRGFLETIKDKIATTFDAANGTLLQLIRVQQADTTAARLGMEASLTSYLNSAYQTTEYLSDVSGSVKSALYEAVSQMSAQQGVAFEYQVQKWLGSLYSVGMSSQAIQGLATALGYLGSGNINALQNSGMQNLIVMAASKMNQGYGGLLTGGLNENTTNELLKNIVEYLADIADNGNNVVRSQLASVFGMSVSDLVAVSNLASDVAKVSKGSLNYAGAMNELYSQVNKMYSRTSIGELLGTAAENFQYSLSSGIANNPALFGIWKTANLLDQLVGGMPIPTVSFMGTSVDLNTTVADMMKVTALGGSILSGVGSIIGNLSAGAGFNPQGMLNALGMSKSTLSVISRGTGLSAKESGIDVSQKSFIGNYSDTDIYDNAMNDAEANKAKTMAEAKENTDVTTTQTIDEHIVDIYNLLSSVISMNALTVRFQDVDTNSFWSAVKQS